MPHPQELMLYPNNSFTRGNPKPIVYYQDALQLIPIDTIKTFYVNYWSSTTEQYWPTSYYDLKAAMHKTGIISVYIPPLSNELSVARHSCACTKFPTEVNRNIRKINRDLHRIAIQSVNISLEQSRYRKNHDSSGNILDLLNSKLEPQNDLNDAHIEQVWPLNFTVPNAKIITPATVALFTAKTVGIPLLQKAFEKYFNRFRDIIPRAKFFPFNNSTSFTLPKEVRLSGVDSVLSNFSMILALDSLTDFERDGLQHVSDLDTMHGILANLSVTNEQFIDFLRNRIVDYMIRFAAQGIERKIDPNFPVLVHLTPGLSFIKYDCFFATYEDGKGAMTVYDLLTFPHSKIGNEHQFYRMIDLPPSVTSSPDTFSFIFEGSHSKVLSDCLDGVLSGTILDVCVTKEYQPNAIVRNTQLKDITIYTLISSYEYPSTIKVNCPGIKQFTANTPYDITVLSVAPSCTIGFVTHLGTLNMFGNQSYTDVSFPPRILFAYNVKWTNSMGTNNAILFTTAIVALVLLMLTLLGTAIYFLVHIKSVRVTDVSETSSNASSDSQITVRNYVFSPIPQGSGSPIPQGTAHTLPRRNVTFKEAA